MSYHSPSYFVLFALLAVCVAWGLYRRKKRRPTLQFSNVSLLSGVKPTWKARLNAIPILLKVLAIGLMILALARPQSSDTREKKNVEGIDIVIALDISDSMLIEDMKPTNRLEAAKMVAKNFIEQRVSDRIGLVLFSGEAFTKVPPTLDYKILLEELAAVDITRTIKMGTAIGLALANSVARLKDSTAKSRVVILLTDGENNSGTIDPETALEIAKGYGIRVYTIGQGVDGLAQLPIYETDMFGNKRKRYQPMHSTVNDELLGKIAQETGGKYFRATNTEALSKVFNEISRLEKTKIEVNKFTRYTEHYQDWLRYAVLFYILSVFFGRVIFRRGP